MVVVCAYTLELESMNSFRSNIQSEDEGADSDGATSVFSVRGKKKRRRRKGKKKGKQDKDQDKDIEPKDPDNQLVKEGEDDDEDEEDPFTLTEVEQIYLRKYFKHLDFRSERRSLL